MPTYDQLALTELVAEQFTGTTASVTAIKAICRDARDDPTERRHMLVPGRRPGEKVRMEIGDWIVTPSAGIFKVYSNTEFVALYAETA